MTTLLSEARSAGLVVVADGDLLRVRGPKAAGEIARRLLDRKADVLAVLARERAPVAVAKRSGNPMPMHQGDADRPVAGDVARPILATLAESGMHPADAPALRLIRQGIANRVTHKAADLVDVPTAELEDGVVQLDERIGIMHHDGNLAEAEAERAAVADLVRRGWLWAPPCCWAVELRRRAGIIDDAHVACRFRRAAEVLERSANSVDGGEPRGYHCDDE